MQNKSFWMRHDRRIRDAVTRHGLDLSLWSVSKSRVHECASQA